MKINTLLVQLEKHLPHETSHVAKIAKIIKTRKFIISLNYYYY